MAKDIKAIKVKPFAWNMKPRPIRNDATKTRGLRRFPPTTTIWICASSLRPFWSEDPWYVSDVVNSATRRARCRRATSCSRITQASGGPALRSPHVLGAELLIAHASRVPAGLFQVFGSHSRSPLEPYFSPPPNGSRLSCGRRARWRKAVGRQTKRLACERPAASSACQAALGTFDPSEALASNAFRTMTLILPATVFDQRSSEVGTPP